MYSVNNNIVLNMPLSEVHETMEALMQRAIEIENEYGYEERENEVRIEICDKSFTPSYIIRYFQNYEVYPIYDFFTEIKVEGEEKMVISAHSGTYYDYRQNEAYKIIRQKLVDGRIVEQVKMYGVHKEAKRIDLPVKLIVGGEDFISLEQAEIILNLNDANVSNELYRWEKQFFYPQCDEVKDVLRFQATGIVSEEYLKLKKMKYYLKLGLG